MFDLQPAKNEITIDGFNSIYYFEFGKDFTHAPEKHDFWEMVYVDFGNVVTITDGAGYVLQKGDVIFHEPGEIHAHISDKKAPNNMLVISFTTSSKAMNFFKKKTFKVNSEMKNLLKMFISETRLALGKIISDYENKSNLDFSDSQFGSTQLLSLYLSEFLIKLIRENTSSKIVHNTKSQYVAHTSMANLIADYLNDNVYSDLKLKDICSHFIMGKSQLSLIFKSYTHESIMKYYSLLKINEAKKLIRSDKYSISEISDMLGFSCIHTFSRKFKNIVGRSPENYKKTII